MYDLCLEVKVDLENVKKKQGRNLEDQGINRDLCYARMYYFRSRGRRSRSGSRRRDSKRDRR